MALRYRPVAVIRLNTTDEEVPRPVQVTITDEDDSEVKTKERTTQVFRIDPDPDLGEQIFPIAVNTDHRRELMMVTARLCHQAVAWKHRTRYPIPLHAALQMDKDHPQYRRTITPEDLDGETNSEAE
ncbi:RNaseH domain-containing protein [Streptomyces antibioticus]|uniref:RNaseH domain-containing protein n=1 Tax=Streptomyces antibioticus TaxID=1890 RepID=UPI0036D9F764